MNIEYSHRNVYKSLRRCGEPKMQKAGEYIRIALKNGTYIVFCSPDGQYKNKPLRFREQRLLNIFKQAIEIPDKAASNGYFCCKVTDWQKFFEIMKEYADIYNQEL